MVGWRGLLVAAALVTAERATADDKPAGGAPAAAGEQPADAGDASKLTDERRRAAAALIGQLGSPRFEVREEATKKLEQSGIDAVGPLLAAAGGDNLEVTCRAIRALGVI